MSILRVPVSSKDHIQGNENASITLVEYGDYECPYCKMAYPVVKKVQEHFGNQLRFVFRNFPLKEVHPHAEIAAETAEFASDHGEFWEMHDLIYELDFPLSKTFLFELTSSLELSVIELQKALEQDLYKQKIQQDFLGGVRSGVNGTPTFFINDHRYSGPAEFHSIVAAIESVHVS